MVYKKSVSVYIFSFNRCTCTVLDIVAARSQSYMGFLGFFICAMQGLFKRVLYKYYTKFIHRTTIRTIIRIIIPWFIKAYKKRPSRLAFTQGSHPRSPP